MKCLVTQHECGSDTDTGEAACECANCVAYTMEREERIAAAVAERLALNGGQYTRYINPGES